MARKARKAGKKTAKTTTKKTRKATRRIAVRTPPPKQPTARKTVRRAGRRARAALGLRGDPTNFVLDVLSETLGNLKITAATKLGALGYDKPGLAALAARIRARGVNVDTAAIQNCTTVGDVVDVVSRA